MAASWNPPADWTKIRAIDAHTAGEPLRVILEGIPEIPGKTILEKRRYARKYLDDLRKAVIWEPRGHADMYGCILTKATTPDGDLGVLFVHNEGFSTMCGHGIIGLTTVVFEIGLRQRGGSEKELAIDTPAGRVTARAIFGEGHVREVSFRNVPSFAYALDQSVQVPGLGRVRYDLAFGGAFYAFCSAEDFGLRLVPEEASRIIELGVKIKQAVSRDHPPRHPFEEDLSFLYGTIFCGPPHQEDHHSRNVCIFADGEVDRSPTGTGVCARAALLHARGELRAAESFTVESILGTCFQGRVVDTLRYGPHQAVIPEVTGSAFIIGKNELLINPRDPLRHGFFLR